MVADADLQVWLDTQPGAHQTVMIPYVKSARDMRINYRIELVQQSGGSTSRINQQGKVFAIAAQPTPIGSYAVGWQQGGVCRIELVLHNDAGTGDLGSYRFDCPR